MDRISVSKRWNSRPARLSVLAPAEGSQVATLTGRCGGGKSMSPYRAVALCLVTCLLTSAPAPSVACGDKLVALGGGVRFERVVVSRHPGRILLVLSPGSGLDAANSRFNLAASLALAGHTVVKIGDPAELGDTLTDDPVDLVLVDSSDFRGIALRTGSVDLAPTIVPVKYQGLSPAGTSAGKAADCVADAGERKGKTLLRTVEKTLDLRSRGLPSGCLDGPGSNRT